LTAPGAGATLRHPPARTGGIFLNQEEPDVARPAKKAPPKKASKPQPKKAPARTAAKAAVKASPPPPAPVKVVPPPAPVEKPVVKKIGKNPLSEKEMLQVRADLEEMRETLTREIADLEASTLSVMQSELSGEASFDEEYADAGTFTFERERDLSLGNNMRDLLSKVDHALRRIADRTYGVCERCGEAIDKARLKALPYSVLCIRCKQLEEGAP
jgi:RNA polymerase-binding protein DksA